MDNPQHYQPLSHALNPPIVQPQYEEEEEEGEDEGAVEEQLERDEDDADESSRPVQQAPGANGTVKQRGEPAQSMPPPPSGPPTSEEVERKRRPGRPRGSKNRRVRGSGIDRDVSAANPATAKPSTGTSHGFYQYSAPPAPGEVHPHNQQYYEFQWRVLNLCAEFYGAAEELIKATPSLVITQCYQMGPGVKVDPLTMLGEAKRICDTLLASPARLTAHPPPVPYPFIPGYTPLPPQAPHPQVQPTPSPSTNGKPTSTTPSAASMISNPSSFVVPMGHQHPSQQQFVPGVYSAPSYPTAPYYGYSGYNSFYPPAPPPQAGPSTSTASNGSTGPIPGSAGNQGAWSDEETEKLKKLAEEHRNGSGEIAWDALCEKWGNSRTRHQILIKATSLGLKESSSRGTKRRRDTDSQASSDRPPPSVPTPSAENSMPTLTSAPPPQPAAPVQQSTHAPAPPVQAAPPVSTQPSASPAPSTPATSAQPSPAIRHAQTQAPTSRNFPYPMPTVAAATSPVISTTAPQQTQERSGNNANAFYRRPNPPAGHGSKPPSHGHAVTTHQYMYQPNVRREN